MSTEIPSFQTEIFDVYSPEEVEVLALNENANRTLLELYAADTTAFDKNVVITFPMLFDEMEGELGLTFEKYEASDAILPSIFLVDQTGILQLRYDGADEPDEFNPELEEIIATIDELLANPPEGR